LLFSVSLWVDSFSPKLVKIAAEGAREAGAQVAVISLKSFPMPLCDQVFHSACWRIMLHAEILGFRSRLNEMMRVTFLYLNAGA
jgi:multimeric flavodoxin WrbA